MSPSPTAPTAPAQAGLTSHRFSPVNRGRGYHRVGGAVVAAGQLDGRPARLGLGLERVAVATVTHRVSQAPFEVTAVGEKTTAALSAVAAVAGLTGRVEVSVKVPWARDSGCDVDVAAAHAAVAALLEATDTPATVALREAVAAALGGSTPLPVEEGFGIFDAVRGTWLRQFEHFPRFNVQLWHQPGSSTSDLGAVGELPDTEPATDPAGAGAWLTAANGPGVGRLAEVLTDLYHSDEEVLGVIGGHAGTDPVGLLLSPDVATAGAAAYRLRNRVAVLAGDLTGFVPTFVGAARPS